MTKTTEIKFDLSKEDIEKAIVNYIKENNPDLPKEGKVSFKLKDIAEDDDRGPYRPIYVLDSAEVKF